MSAYLRSITTADFSEYLDQVVRTGDPKPMYRKNGEV